MMLSFTKNQLLILEVFFNQPARAYYFRELARVLGKKAGVFQRDINKLAEEGIVESYRQGNNRFFRLNKKYPLHQELKSIFLKTRGIEAVIKRELKKIKGVRKAYLYGSFAQGRERGSSDIDLLIIGFVDEKILADILDKLEKKFNREINYTLMQENEFQRKRRVKNSFLANIFNKKIIELA